MGIKKTCMECEECWDFCRLIRMFKIGSCIATHAKERNSFSDVSCIHLVFSILIQIWSPNIFFCSKIYIGRKNVRFNELLDSTNSCQ